MGLTPLVTRAIVVPSGRAIRARVPGERLFDEVSVQHHLVARFLLAPSAEIATSDVPPAAGVYGLRYHGDHAAYEALDDHRFVYIGKASYLPERAASHVASLREANDLEVADFSFAALPLDALLHAELAERLLTGAFDPLWCRRGWKGFGSRPQGRGRRRQRPTDWDRRHPGRLTRVQGSWPANDLRADARSSSPRVAT